MKKILALVCLTLAVLTTKVHAQSNLTWIVKDKLTGDAVKRKLDFTVSLSGLGNQNEMTAFCQKIRSNNEVASCEDLGKDAAGNYTIRLKMKNVQDAKYYLGWVQKLGVAFIDINGEKKTPEEWAQSDKNK